MRRLQSTVVIDKSKTNMQNLAPAKPIVDHCLALDRTGFFAGRGAGRSAGELWANRSTIANSSALTL
jgi:hypothetical protein